MIFLRSALSSRTWATALCLSTLLISEVALCDTDEQPSEVAAPSADTSDPLEVVRTGALKRLEGPQQTLLQDIPRENLVQLLDSPEGSKLSEEEQLIVEAMNKEAFESSLNYQTGSIELQDGLATLHLSRAFRYLSPEDSERLLVEGWGNPPGGESLGMIIPSDTSPLHEEKGWGVIVTYVEEGHVDDDDAEDMDYEELLEDMQEDTQESSKARVEQGYSAIELVGWAEPPHYDPETHRLYWAKELSFAGSTDNTLNYAIRVLGRKGVLQLNAVAGMSQLAQVRQDMKRVLPLAEFQSGQTYSDFDPDMDEVAAYGIGGLIAGKVLAKVGLFAGLLKFLVVIKKFIIIAIAGFGGLLMKWFKGRREG